jgi:hypothetical protein
MTLSKSHDDCHTPSVLQADARQAFATSRTAPFPELEGGTSHPRTQSMSTARSYGWRTSPAVVVPIVDDEEVEDFTSEDPIPWSAVSLTESWWNSFYGWSKGRWLPIELDVENLYGIDPEEPDDPPPKPASPLARLAFCRIGLKKIVGAEEDVEYQKPVTRCICRPTVTCPQQCLCSFDGTVFLIRARPARMQVCEDLGGSIFYKQGILSPAGPLDILSVALSLWAVRRGRGMKGEIEMLELLNVQARLG